MNTTSSLVKAGILASILVIIAVACWELFVRSKGFDTNFDDGGPIWAHKRAMVYEPADQATVFIGSSRIKFDLDVETWESLTGDHAIQLACVGSNPIPVLKDLAEDKKFKGKLIVDVTEGIFFSTSPFNTSSPEKNIKYYKDQTPAQRASFFLNRGLESVFAFLDKDRLSMNAELDNLEIPDRKGVFPNVIFPVDFGRIKFSRQEYMTESFVADSSHQNKVKGLWDFFDSMDKDPPISGKKLDSIMMNVIKYVDQIQSRGGKILFVRTPSSGSVLEREKKGYPREQYWDQLLARTGCPGIHYADYPAIASFICPENSHLSQEQAKVFTKALIKILSGEKGWKFLDLAPIQ